MKRVFVLSLLVLVCSCSKEEEKPLPRNADLKFTITSDDTGDNRESGIIASLIANGNDTIFADVTGLGKNFPYSRSFTDQTVDKGTTLELLYTDFTILEINGTYKPYQVTLTIVVDNEQVRSTKFDLETIGEIVKVSYTFE